MRALLAAVLVAVVGSVAVAAQTAPVQRVRGDVQSLDGQTLTVKTREGPSVPITLAPDYGVIGLVKADLSSIKPGTFIGTAAVPQPDGMLRALEVLIFPESARGSGEGHYPWDLMPESTMTNATVADLVTQTNGRVLTLKYKDGEKKVLVPERVPIVTFAPADRSLLGTGAHIFVTATRQPDGTLMAGRVLVGKDGLVPPM